MEGFKTVSSVNSSPLREGFFFLRKYTHHFSEHLTCCIRDFLRGKKGLSSLTTKFKVGKLKHPDVMSAIYIVFYDVTFDFLIL